jgi:cell division protein FtsN
MPPAKPAAPAKVALGPTKPAPAPTEPAVTELATPEAAPPPAPASSGVMIQLGSFPNSGLAASAWSKIKSANQDLLGTYSPTIKPAPIEGKGTWYRLRVGGFADKAAARQVCDQLTANGQACIIAGK